MRPLACPRSAKTPLVLHDFYPNKEALDAAMASGEQSGMCETFEQLDELLLTLARAQVLVAPAPWPLLHASRRTSIVVWGTRCPSRWMRSQGRIVSTASSSDGTCTTM